MKTPVCPVSYYRTPPDDSAIIDETDLCSVLFSDGMKEGE